MTRRAIVTAVLLTLFAGAAVGAVAANTGTKASRTTTPVAAPINAQPSGGPALVPRPGTVHLIASTPDPDGGAPWAIRTFMAPRVTGKPGVWRCAQLGRVVGGRFGWIRPGTTRLRPVPIAYGALTRCGAAGAADRWGSIGFQALVADALGPAPRLTGTVAWGLTRPASRALTAWIAPDRAGRSTARGGGVIAFGPPAARKWDVVLESGGVTRRSLDNGFGESRRDVHDLRVAARAPDPAGGPTLGLLERTAGNGTSCTVGPAPLVDGQVGQVDADLGLFGGGNGCSPRIAPTRDDPFVALGGSATNGGPQGAAAAAAARAATTTRRTLPGWTSIAGPLPADVVRVEIRTPRDLRTLRAGPRHVLLAVWDGTFPSGTQATLIATFRDGTTVTRHRMIGF